MSYVPKVHQVKPVQPHGRPGPTRLTLCGLRVHKDRATHYATLVTCDNCDEALRRAARKEKP